MAVTSFTFQTTNLIGFEPALSLRHCAHCKRPGPARHGPVAVAGVHLIVCILTGYKGRSGLGWAGPFAVGAALNSGSSPTS
ncbi:hypothetical protein J6590_058939 [Homalodisca vitripennis]|nr:hypothetical protein J6590_058939 [Homalodisca vitripennis]